ncbi:MAG TPA: hypothetical protein VMG12_40025 [Polyangiaceae bacterium]|nr:hypothetical protein [Polyangiaceae bacterium]
MHRLTTSWLGFGVSVAVSLAAVSCGAPAELDPGLYPGPNDTGYADDDGTGTAGTPLGGAGAGGTGSTAGAGSPSAGSTGTGSTNANGNSGVSGASSSNNSSSNAGAGAPSGAAGSAQSGTAGGGSTPAMGGGATAGGCPDDITVLFDRPLSEGGCAGAGCHVDQGTPPNLVSPNPEMRLVNVMSSCNGRPYIGGDNGFLADKIGGETPECGSPMPFLSADLLTDEDRQCILDWIDEVSGG